MESAKPQPKEAPVCLLDRPIYNPIPSFLKSVVTTLVPKQKQQPKENKK